MEDRPSCGVVPVTLLQANRLEIQKGKGLNM